MMVERHGPEQIGNGDPQTVRNCSQGLLRQESVPVVKIVENREEGCWLFLPPGKDIVVADGGHRTPSRKGHVQTEVQPIR